MTVALIFLVALLVLTPIFCSFVYCVPGWYRKKVQSHVPALPKRTRLPRFVTRPFRWFFGLLAVPVVFIILLMVWYIDVVAVFIKRKCPYTTPSSSEVKVSIPHPFTLSVYREVVTGGS